MTQNNSKILDGFRALADRHKMREDVNCEWRIAAPPKGHVKPSDFQWAETPIPKPGPNEVLLKTISFGVAPVMRFYMEGNATAGEKALSPGDVIHGRGVAQVVESNRDDVKVVELWQGQMGWRTYKTSALTSAEKFYRINNTDLPAELSSGILGMTGISAHSGYMGAGSPRAGDNVLVSGAVGGVGSLVVQMARITGAKKVIGVAGGPEKCAFLKTELGCDDAIDYRNENVAARIAQLFPEGVDYYFDNVGGDTLSAVLENLAMFARILLCGSISEYTLGHAYGLENYTRLRVVEGEMKGFFVYNHLDRFDEIVDEMAQWIREGRLKPVQDYEEGFERMPLALAKLFFSANKGVQCIRVRPSPPL